MPRLNALRTNPQPRLAPPGAGPAFVITADFRLQAGVRPRIAEQTRTAYEYVARLHGWQGNPALNAPVRVHVLSAAQMQARYPGAAAYCAGPDDIYVQAKVGARDFAAVGVLVHELTHLQHNRMKRGSLPQYMEEGSAVVAQRQAMQHFGFTDPKLSSQRQLLAQVTPRQVRATLDHFRTGADTRVAQRSGELRLDESIGALFVSFLATQLGERRVEEKLGRVIEQLPEQKRTSPDYDAHLDAAFQRVFGISAMSAENEFVDFIRRTAGRPSLRFAGTVWA